MREHKITKWSLWVQSKMLHLKCSTQQELADKLGVSRSTVQQWIVYGRLPRYDMITKLKKMFPNDDWNWLLSDNN